MVMDVIIDVLMVFLPITGYVSQYREILKTKNAHGFSPLTSFILIVSNILRIFFWYFERFALALFFQSLIMIAAQFLLLHLIVRSRSDAARKRLRSLLEWEWSIAGMRRDFWNWSDFLSYGLFCTALSWIVMFFTYINSRSMFFAQLLGTLALGIEATLAVPQIVRNYQHQSAAGLSRVLVLTWFLGDTFKAVFFIVKEQPMQFLLCAVFQLVMDGVVMLQIYLYGKKNQEYAL